MKLMNVNSFDLELLIVDDQPAIRKGLISYFETKSLFSVVGELNSAGSLPTYLKKNVPDVMIIEPKIKKDKLSYLDYFQIMEHAKESNKDTSVIMYSNYDHVSFQNRIIALGADAFVSKREPLSKLESVTKLVKSEYYSFISSKSEEFFSELLTNQEMNILNMVAEGKTNKEIAYKACISLRTVSYHLDNIYSKFGTRSRTNAVIKAIQLDYVDALP